MSNAFSCALRLLTRREHGAYELVSKLAQKGYEDIDAHEALLKCQQLGLQSDKRFVESICRVRIRQGYGPVRIRQELQGKQLASELIDAALQLEEDNWFEYAFAAWKKKYKASEEITFVELQKQKQFLLYRGFTSDIISKLFKQLPSLAAEPFI